MDSYPEPDTHTIYIIYMINSVLTIVFVFEFLLKLIGLGLVKLS
jgi:hypothetical protein